MTIDWTLIFLKFFFGVFEVFGLIALGLSLLRIPYSKFTYEVIVLSTVVSSVNTANYYIFDFNLVFNEVFNLVVLILLCKPVLKITFYFATLLTVTGYISSMLILYVFFIVIEKIISINLNDLLGSYTFTIIAQLVLFSVMTSIGKFFYKKRIGFIFVNEGFTFQSGYKMINISLISALVLSVIIIELTIVSLIANYGLSKFLVIIAIMSVDIVFWIIYIRSNKDLESYYNNRFT